MSTRYFEISETTPTGRHDVNTNSHTHPCRKAVGPRLSKLQLKIESDIVAILRRKKFEAGVRLCESHLATELGTSRQPVNVALRHLANMGVLVYSRQRGYYISRDAHSLGESALHVLAFHDDALYLQIAEDRLCKRLPDVVSESALMRRYHVARSAIRNTLFRISYEQWVEKSPGYGWAFLPMIDSYEGYLASQVYRASIEPCGLISGAFLIDSYELSELLQEQSYIADSGFREMKAFELFDADRRFHETIAKWSGNRFILHGVRHINQLRRLIEYRFHRGNEVSSHSQAVEHLAILTAIRDAKMQHAAELMRAHIERGEPEISAESNLFQPLER